MKVVSIKKMLPVVALLLALGVYSFYPRKKEYKLLETVAFRGPLEVDVKTVGVLEACRCHAIASEVRGDQAKILFLANDGETVEKGELLVRLDPSPFETKVQELETKMSEQQLYVEQLGAALRWEMASQFEEERSLECEYAIAQVDRDRAVHVEGPAELQKLKTAYEKAEIKYSEIAAFEEDLDRLEKEGYLNPGERKQAEKKLSEERENFETAKLLYDAFKQQTYPMLVKKSDLALRKAEMKLKEGKASCHRKVAKAKEQYEAAKLGFDMIATQLADAKNELTKTEIKAPEGGMVVHREEYRAGERRRPRVGDIALKNQPLIDLPDLSRMIVKTKVREVDLHKISIGIPASIEIDAYPYEPFSGRVQSIGVLALAQMKKEEEKYFEVRILLSETKKELRPGMTARTTIHTAHLDDALLIPVHALFYRGGAPSCYVKSIKGVEERTLKIGLHSDEWAEVKEGLQEGEVVSLSVPL